MEIKQITEQNPWWRSKKAIEKDEKVREALSKKEKIVFPHLSGNWLIVGPRQVGKTTYLKLCIRELIGKGVSPQRILYFSCEMLKNPQEIVEIIRFADSLLPGKKYLFFDEITFVKDWQKAIKYFLDSPLGKGKNLYLSGSSSLAFKKETFPGREIKIREFLPLSFAQFCHFFGSNDLKKAMVQLKIKKFTPDQIYSQAKKLLFFFSEISDLLFVFLRTGGFPRSIYEWREKEELKSETYEIYWKWLVSDIAKIERSERIASAVLLGILKNYASRFSLNSVAKEMEIGSHVTVREYLEILEELFVLRNIFAFDFKKKAAALRRMRKVYLIDPFLFAVFKKTLTQGSVTPEDRPKIVEGVVAEHLIRKRGKIFYYQEKKEVDFVCPDFGLEVKWQKKVTPVDYPKVSLKNKILLSQTDFDFSKKRNLIVIPTGLFLSLL